MLHKPNDTKIIVSYLRESDDVFIFSFQDIYKNFLLNKNNKTSVMRIFYFGIFLGQNYLQIKVSSMQKPVYNLGLSFLSNRANEVYV